MLLIAVFTVVLLASLKRGLILPIMLIYAVIPIRYWNDALTSTNILQLGTDSIVALIFIFGFVVRILFSPSELSVYLWQISNSVLFLFAAFLSALAMSLLGDIYGIKMFIRIAFPLIVFVFVVSEYQSGFEAQRILSGFIFIGVVVSALGIMATFIGVETWHVSAGVMRYGPLGSISDYSYLMALMTIFTYVRFRFASSKILYGMLTILFFSQCLFTVTRGGIFGAVIAIASIELFGTKKRLSNHLLMVVFLIVSFFSIITFYSPLRERVFATHYKDVKVSDSVGSKLTDSFAKSGRSSLWGFVTSSTIETPYILLGHGLGSVEVEVVKAVGGVTHNEYIRVLYEQGIVGLFLFCGLLLQLWKIGRWGSFDAKHEDLRLIALTLIGVLALYASGSMVDNMMNKYKNMGAPLYMLAAFSLIQMRRITIQAGLRGGV